MWQRLRSRLVRSALRHQRVYDAARRALEPVEFAWYPYNSYMNAFPIDRLLGDRSLDDLAAGRPVLDVGAADGAFSFFMESLGFEVHAVDWPATNMNGMRAIRALKGALGSSVEIHEADLDGRFTLPAGPYGLALFLGTLYHLKNPFYAVETLAREARDFLLSTRIASWTPGREVNFSALPMAYLLEAGEANNDDTNYWIFSEAGLRRLLERAGWTVCDLVVFGQSGDANPSDAEKDARAFCLLESRVAR